MKTNSILSNPIFLRWFYLIGVVSILALPLITSPLLFQPPAWGKTIIFRIIFSLLLSFSAYQALFKNGANLNTSWKELKDRKSSIFFPFWLLIGFLFISLLSTIFSINQYFSFWGNPQRAGGFLNFAFYIIFAIGAFLTIKTKDWKKIWNFSIIVGIFVSIVAIIQQFNLLKGIIIFTPLRPPSTLGSPIILALYLLLLIFLTLSFGINEKRFVIRFFYFSAFILFIFTIILSGTRAAYLGLILGSLFFILFYPKKIALLKAIKIAAGVLLLIGTLGVYYLNTHPEILSMPSVQKNLILSSFLQRSTFKFLLTEPRFSGWRVALEAIKEKPIFGYGPENFSVAFDKYYDPSLPYLSIKDIMGWWDRSHSFIFDSAVTTGIPSLIIYLLLFGTLFWRLQKLKNDEQDANDCVENPSKIIYHGIQATFIAYLTGNLFSFDTFSTYLISFLLIGYSLFLIAGKTRDYTSNEDSGINKFQSDGQPVINTEGLFKNAYRIIISGRKFVLIILFLFLIWFLWFFNLKPLLINKEINRAIFYSQNKKCEEAFSIMEKILPSHSFLDHYLRLQYVDIIKECLKANPQLATELSLKAIKILDETIKLKPEYTRSWLLLGNYINIFVESNEKIEQALKEEFLKKADYSFQRAYELSPKRQEIFIGWINTDMISGKYTNAEHKAEKCIDLYSGLGECWWLKGLSNLLLNNPKQFEEDIKIASQKGFNTTSKNSLSLLLKVYSILIKNSDGNKIEYYPPLVGIYQKLISLNPESFQYHASLAFVYKVLGNYKEARAESLIALKLSPESKASVEAFLKTLPY